MQQKELMLILGEVKEYANSFGIESEFHRGTIWKCCNNYVSHITHKGYYWKYLDESKSILKPNHLKRFLIEKKVPVLKTPKMVEKINPNTNEIWLYKSPSEASRSELDSDVSHIISCCNNKRKSHKGFKLRYK